MLGCAPTWPRTSDCCAAAACSSTYATATHPAPDQATDSVTSRSDQRRNRQRQRPVQSTPASWPGVELHLSTQRVEPIRHVDEPGSLSYRDRIESAAIVLNVETQPASLLAHPNHRVRGG